MNINNTKHPKIFVLILLFSYINVFGDFSPPLPEPGTATVDGDHSEWNLTDDFFCKYV